MDQDPQTIAPAPPIDSGPTGELLQPMATAAPVVPVTTAPTTAGVDALGADQSLGGLGQSAGGAAVPPADQGPPEPLRSGRRWWRWPTYILASLLVLGGLGYGGYRLWWGGHKPTTASSLGSAGQSVAGVGITDVDLSGVAAGNQSAAGQRIDVNGLLKVNNELVLAPTTRPTNPQLGQVYLDSTTETLYVYNGTQFVALGSGSSTLTGGGGIQVAGTTILNTGVLSLQGQVGNVTLGSGSGIAINGTTITNGGVLSVQGQSGAVALTAGLGVAINGTNIANSGVVSLQGQTGAVSLTGGSGVSIGGTTVGLDSSVARLSSAGDGQTFTGAGQIFRNANDSAAGFLVQNSSGASELVVNTSSNQVGIGIAPSYKFDVNGNINIESGFALKIGGTTVCDISGCSGGGGGGPSILNSTALQPNANFNIQTGDTTQATATIQALGGQTANLFQVLNSGAANLFSIGPSGSILAPGTYNTNVFNGSTLTFGAASAAAIQSAAGQALNLTGHASSTISTDAGNLTIQGGSGTVSLGSSTALVANGALSVGSTGQTLTLQGGASTSLAATSGGITSQLVFATPTTTNKTITIPNETGQICTTAGSAACADVYALASGSAAGYIQFAPHNIQVDSTCEPTPNPSCDTSTIFVGKSTVEGNILDLQGVATDGGGLQPALVLNGNGQMFFRSLTPNSQAFQIQNAGATPILNISTVATSNLIAQPSSDFEADTTGTWASWANSGATPAALLVCNDGVADPNCNVAHNNSNYSMEIQNATQTSGHKQGPYYAVSLPGGTIGTQYTLAFYATAVSVKNSKVTAGYYTGSPSVDANRTQCGSKTVTLTQSWSLYSCTFTIGAGNTASGIYLYSNTSNMDWAIDDAVLLAGNSNVAQNGQFDVTSPAVFSTTNADAFQIQDGGGNNVFNEDTTTGSATFTALGNPNGGIQTNMFQLLNSTGGQILGVDAGTTGGLGAWSTAAAKLPSKTFGFQGTSANDINGNLYGYVVGGVGSGGGGTPLSTVYYGQLGSTGVNSWNLNSAASLSNAPVSGPREFAGTVSAGGYVYLIGGDDGTTVHSQVYYAQVNSNNSLGPWVALQSLTTPRTHVQAVVYNGFIYVVGGSSTINASGALNSVEYAQILGDGTLGPWTTSGNVLPAGLRDQAVTANNGVLWAVGGTDHTGVAQTAVLYATINVNGSIGGWATDTPLAVARSGSTAAIDPNTNLLYVFGGISNTTPNTSDTKSSYLIGTIDTVNGGVTTWTKNYFNLSATQINQSGLIFATPFMYLIGSTSDNTNATIFAQIQGVTNAVHINGSLDVSQAASFDGTLTVASATNSASAVQVTNASGGSLLNVNTNSNAITLNQLNSPDFNNWSHTGALPVGIEGNGSAVVNGYVYSISGSSSGSGTGAVRYAKLNTDGSISDNGWQSTTALPAPGNYKIDNATIAANGYIYVIGGYDAVSGSGASSTVYVGKPNSDGTIGSWRTTSSLATAVASPGVAVYNGYLYVLGGATSSSGGVPSVPTAVVQKAQLNPDGTLGGFGPLASLPAARMGGRAAVATGYLYFTGGNDNSGGSQTGAPQTNVYCDSIGTGSIGSWNSTCGTLSDTRAYHTSLVANGYLYVIAGADTTGNTRTVLYSQIQSDGTVPSWQASGSTTFGATSNHASAFENGYLYIIGGDPSSTSVQYASAARVAIGGSLDLVGLGSKTLSDAGGGGQLTAGDTTIVGTLDVRDSADFTQSVAIDGSLAAHGQVLFQDSSPSATALAVQNASGLNVASVDTTNGQLSLGQNDGTNALTGKLTFYNSTNTNTLTLQGSATTSNLTLTLPTADGSLNQCLQTNGSGVLSFGNCVGGPGGASGVSSLDTLTGDLNILGTANEISVTPSGSNIILATPQNINTAATPTFGGLTLASTGSATALVVQNASNNAVLTTDTSANQVLLGKASTLAGKLVFANAANANLVGLTASSTGSSYTLSLPTAGPAVNQCLQTDPSTATQLIFGNCVGTGGANTALSNLASTAINTNLSFASGADRTLTIATPGSGNTAGNNLTVSAASGLGSGNGGGLMLLGGGSGTTSGNGGSVSIQGGANNGGLGSGGAISLIGGGGVTGGNIGITGGSGAAGGSVSINAGGTFSTPGTISIGTLSTGGGQIKIGDNTASPVSLLSGTGAINLTSSSGNITLQNSNSGSISLQGGSGGALGITADTGVANGGNLSITSGASTGTLGHSGTLTIKSGDGGLGGSSGTVTIDTGVGGVSTGVINIGTGNASGVNIGNFGGVVVNGGTTSFAFVVQNASNNAVLTTDTSANQVLLGKTSTLAGKLVFANAANANLVGLTASSTGSSYTLSLPTAGPAVNQCLQTDPSTATQLIFGSCIGPGGSGANTALSNLASTAINADLTFASSGGIHNIRVATPASTGAGDGLNVQAASGNGTGAGGNASLSGGTGGSSGAGGVAALVGGNGGGGNSNGGNVVIQGGTPSGTGSAGSILIGTSNNASIFVGQNAAHSGTQSIVLGGGGSGSATLVSAGSLDSSSIVQLLAGSASIGVSQAATQINCGTGSCGLGNDAADHTTTVGSTTGASATTIQGGSSGVSVQAASGATVTIGNSGANNAVTIGSTTGTSALTLQAGSAGIAVNSDLTFSIANHTIAVAGATTNGQAGKTLTVAAAAGKTTGAGGTLNLNGGAGGNNAAGGVVAIAGGAAGGGNNNGGNVTIQGGALTGVGSAGNVLIGAANTGNVTIGSAANISTLTTLLSTTSGLSVSSSGIDVQCGTVGTCGFGDDIADHPTTVGSTTGASATTVQGGTSGVSIQSAASSTINIGTSNSQAVVIGKSGGTGTLTVNGTLSVNGHIISGNASGSTTATAGTITGCIDNSNGSLSRSGNDTAGTITITTGGSCSSGGKLATLIFANFYTGSSTNLRVILTPANANASTLQYYNGAITTSGSDGTGFTVDTNTTPAITTTYKFNYLVVQ